MAPLINASRRREDSSSDCSSGCADRVFPLLSIAGSSDVSILPNNKRDAGALASGSASSDTKSSASSKDDRSPSTSVETSASLSKASTTSASPSSTPTGRGSGGNGDGGSGGILGDGGAILGDDGGDPSKTSYSSTNSSIKSPTASPSPINKGNNPDGTLSGEDGHSLPSSSASTKPPTAFPTPTGKANNGGLPSGGLGDILGNNGKPSPSSLSSTKSPTSFPTPTVKVIDGGHLAGGANLPNQNPVPTPNAPTKPSDGSNGGVRIEGSAGDDNPSTSTQASSTLSPPLPSSTADGGTGTSPQNTPPSDTRPKDGKIAPPDSPTSSLSSADPLKTSGPKSPGKASKAPAVQVAANTLPLPSASSTRAVLTTEIFPTVIPFTTISAGFTSTGFQTVTTSSIVTPTSGSGRNGNAQPDHGSSNNTGAIAGGVIGALLAVSFLVAVVFFFLRRRRRARHQMGIKTLMAIPHPDLFRPSPGTGWDVESASNRSSSSSASSGPFVKPMSQTGPYLNLHRKPIPGVIPVPTVSEDPFWDPSQQLDRVPILPVKAERVQGQDFSTAEHNPFADPPLANPNGGLSKQWGDGPSRLSTASTMYDSQMSTAVPFGVAV